MDSFIEKLRGHWYFVAVIFACGIAWGTGQVQLSYAQDAVEANATKIEAVEEDIEEVKEDINEINVSITRIDTNQMHMQNDLAEIKQLLRDVVTAVSETE